jgi:hypothetical protein
MTSSDTPDPGGGVAWIFLVLSEDQLPCFYTLCQEGLRVPAQIGCSIKELLCVQLGLPSSYLQGRIQTLFLDGKPVDDPEKALIREGSTLALSAALPGLAGAALRRGGYLGHLRNSLTYREEGSGLNLHDGVITVRLFNLLLKEIGPILLRRGVLFRARDLLEFFGRRSEKFWKVCRDAKINGKEIGVDELKIPQGLAGHDAMGLRVEFVPE